MCEFDTKKITRRPRIEHCFVSMMFVLAISVALTQLATANEKVLPTNEKESTMNEALQNPQLFYDDSMARAPEVIRSFYVALSSRNSEKLRSVLADDFRFVSPMATLESPEEYVGMVSGFGGWVETEQFIIEGDAVVHRFTLHMMEPAVADIPVCDVFTIKNGIISTVRAYNNPADFPMPPSDE